MIHSVELACLVVFSTIHEEGDQSYLRHGSILYKIVVLAGGGVVVPHIVHYSTQDCTI